MMNINIKQLDKTLPLPKYETSGSVGFDFVSREDTLIKSGELGFIPGNVIVKVPEGYMLLVAARSSTPRKKGLLIPHGLGIIDQDYCGNEDEIKIQVYNFKKEDVLIKRGEKIAQGVFVRIDTVNFKQVENMVDESRGGFGSTDKKIN